MSDWRSVDLPPRYRIGDVPANVAGPKVRLLDINRLEMGLMPDILDRRGLGAK